MTARRILTYPHPTLMKPTSPWDFGRGRQDFLENMAYDLIDSLENSESGIALAANQVGLEASMISFGEKLRDVLPPVVVNPATKWRSPEVVRLEEGCLSFPGIWLQLSREAQVEVEFFRVDGSFAQSVMLEGLAARAWQHEMDHLSGRTFLDIADHRTKYQVIGTMKGRR